MPLLSGFNVTLPEVELLGQASLAAFAGGPIPAGYTVLTPAALGLAAQYQNGNYFSNGSASAIVLQQGNHWIIAFRGSDGDNDVSSYPELATGDYIERFSALLQAVAAQSPPGTEFSFTGASLGGGAVNQMAAIAGNQYGGEFASATFVAFASPNIGNQSGILNVGFENDPIYRAIEGYADNPSSLDNLVLANADFMAGNYDGRHPFDTSAHTAAEGFSVISRLRESAYYENMSPDSLVIFDAHTGLVQDTAPGRESTGAFYLGEAVADLIRGRGGVDVIEGFGGNDTLGGGAGGDVIRGGLGADLVYGNQQSDLVYGNQDNDLLFGGQDNDSVYGGQGVDVVYGNFGDDIVYGNFGDDGVFGGQGNDTMFGGQGNDALYGNLGDDRMFGNLGSDRFVFAAASGSDTIVDFRFSDGDRLALSGQSYTLRDTAQGATLDLSGGGSVLLAGVAASDFSAAYLV